MPALSDAEVRLLFPAQESLGAPKPNRFQLFTRCMTEAREDGQLREGIAVETAVKALFTIFCVAFLSAQLYGDKDVTGFYETHRALLERARA